MQTKNDSSHCAAGHKNSCKYVKIHSQVASSNWILEDLRICGIWSLPHVPKIYIKLNYGL